MLNKIDKAISKLNKVSDRYCCPAYCVENIVDEAIAILKDVKKGMIAKEEKDKQDV